MIPLQVALRKESVDRNYGILHLLRHTQSSLSARRAWIEIHYEGTTSDTYPGRSPQGERG